MAAWIDPTVDVKLEIAFSTDPLATTPTYTDVTAYLRDIPSIQRGASSEDTSIGVGFATFVLSNRDRRFDPDYSSGAYYPNVKPMRRVKLTVTKSSAVVVFTGFVQSWTNDWTIDDGISVVRCVDSMWWLANNTLGLTAFEAEQAVDDPLHRWKMLSETSMFDDVNGVLILEDQFLVDEANYAAAEFVTSIGAPTGDDGGITSSDDTGLLSTLWQNTNVSGALTGEAKTLEFIARASLSAGNGQQLLSFQARAGSGWYVSYSTDAGLTSAGQWYVEYENLSDNKGTPSWYSMDGPLTLGEGHHVAFTADASNVYLYIDGVLTDTQAHGGAYSAMPSQVVVEAFKGVWISHATTYATTLSSTRIAAHAVAARGAFGGSGYKERGGARIGRVLDEIGWSSSLRSLDTGNFGHGAYLPAGQQALDYIRAVVDVERGLFFCDRTGNLNFVDLPASVSTAATGKVFSDDGGAGAIKYAQLRMSPASADTVRNVVTVSYSTVGAITRRDATSEDSYGSSQLFIDGPTLAKARDASSIAAWELAQRKDPSTRVESITVYWRNGTSTDTTNAIDTCSAIEVGDVVTVEVTPMGVGSQVVKTCQVIGIEHEIGLTQGITTLYMRPAYDQSGWFTLGTSALGGTDVLLP